MVARSSSLMIRNATTTPVKPKPSPPRTAPVQPRQEPAQEPPYHVILHDDDFHTYEYVIEMLKAVYGYEEATGLKMAQEVDKSGRVITATVHKELAELRQEQIMEYGPDPRLASSKGSMSASIEPAE